MDSVGCLFSCFLETEINKIGSFFQRKNENPMNREEIRFVVERKEKENIMNSAHTRVDALRHSMSEYLTIAGVIS